MPSTLPPEMRPKDGERERERDRVGTSLDSDSKAKTRQTHEPKVLPAATRK